MITEFKIVIQSPLIEQDTIRKFSGPLKRIYRVFLAELFCSSFTGNYTRFLTAKSHLELLYFALLADDIKTILEDIDDFKKMEYVSVLYLYKDCKLNIVHPDVKGREDYIDEERLNKAVVFFRKYVAEYINSQKTLYRYQEVEQFWNISGFYEGRSLQIHPHHWIDLQPFQYNKPIVTYPEFFAYQDLINTWNDFIFKNKETIKLGFSPDNELSRQIRYSYHTSLRYLLITGVHFAETYLYYLYYHLKHKGIFNNNKLIRRRDVRKITDKQIIKELLFAEYPDLEQVLSSKYKLYEETLEYRDSYVHMSAFTEENSDLSRMQRLINIQSDMVIEHINNIIEMILDIEKYTNQEILFWWKYVETPNFKEKKVISSLMRGF